MLGLPGTAPFAVRSSLRTDFANLRGKVVLTSLRFWHRLPSPGPYLFVAKTTQATLPRNSTVQLHLATRAFYPGRFPTNCFGRKRNPVQVSLIEIWATLSYPPANTGSQPLSRDRSDFTALDRLG